VLQTPVISGDGRKSLAMNLSGEGRKDTRRAGKKRMCVFVGKRVG